jgi:uncharacterized protein YjbJ (UPF0337 family)
MNKDTFKGKWTQLKGEIKQQWGKFTDDDLMQIEGDYDKFLGKVQERYGEQKDAVMKWTDPRHPAQAGQPEGYSAGWSSCHIFHTVPWNGRNGFVNDSVEVVATRNDLRQRHKGSIGDCDFQ